VTGRKVPSAVDSLHWRSLAAATASPASGEVTTISSHLMAHRTSVRLIVLAAVGWCGARRIGRGGPAPAGNHELGETSASDREGNGGRGATRTAHGGAVELHGYRHGGSATLLEIFCCRRARPQLPSPPLRSRSPPRDSGPSAAAAATQGRGLKYKIW
jgi:hypothetical protein